MLPRLLLILLVISLAGCSSRPPVVVAAPPSEYLPAEGDLLFQSFPHSALTDMIEGCTKSPLSHCGVMVNRKGAWKVIEAVGPVKETVLADWIERGRGGGFVVYRLRAPLDQQALRIVAAAKVYEGKPYDPHYDLDDARIYCSELLWKATRDATGTELGKLQTLGELNWKPYEKEIRSLEDGALPLDRKMITPQALTEDSRLVEVYRKRM